MKKLVSVIGPVGTRSGYGSHARDLVISLLDLGYDVRTMPIRWGKTPQNALNQDDPRDKRIIETLRPDGNIERQPDIHVHVSVPTEFNPIGKLNIGITAGVEWTVPNPEWVDAMNRMDLNIVPSNFSKQVFADAHFTVEDPKTKQKREIKVNKPIEVLFEGYDEDLYKKTDLFSQSLVDEMNKIDNDFCFLYTGHWLQGPMGHDRKDVGMMINTFLNTFKDVDNAPALLLKTSCGTFSPPDKYEILRKVRDIKSQVPFKKSLPKIHLLHGELSDTQMNELYNHPKVKGMISFTKGEGFGRPLLEFSTTGKPIIASGWSGHVDFLDKDMSNLLPGGLMKVHKDSIPGNYTHKESQWFSVDYNAGSFAMNECFKKYDKYLSRAYLQRQRSEDFTLNKMTDKFGKILEPYVARLTSHVPVNLPKLQKKDDTKVTLPKLQKA